MPQLNMAPTPANAVAAVATAKAASSGAPAADAAAEAPPAQPFADVLRRQVDQGRQASTSPAGQPAHAASPVAGKAVQSGGLVAALASAKADPAAAELPKADDEAAPDAAAIAAIAPMLPGVAAPVARTATQDAATAATAEPAQEAGKAKRQDDAADAAVLISGPAGFQPALPASAATKAEDAQSTLPLAGTDRKGNIAAESLPQAASHAGPGKEENPENFASLLSQATPAGVAAPASHEARTARADAGALPVSTPVGAHGWDNEVGAKLTWMAGRQESHAELVLNPPQLGRVEVSLSLNGDQANAMFVSAHPAVREALENAIPRLREVLMDAGIALGQAQVGAESFRQSSGNGENGDNPMRGDRFPGAPVDATGTMAGGGEGLGRLRQNNGLVDTFA